MQTEELNKAMVARRQSQLLAYHRTGAVPTTNDITTLYDTVKNYPLDVFDRAMTQLQSLQWKGEYPPTPADIDTQCRMVMKSDLATERAEQSARERPAGLLEEPMTDSQRLFAERVAQRQAELEAEGIPKIAALIKATAENVAKVHVVHR